jgi:hypothetical protein
VMTGRGRPYPFESPQLRLYSEPWALAAFDVEKIAAQIRKQVPAAQGWSQEYLLQRARQVEKAGAGNPISNVLFALEPQGAQAAEHTVRQLLNVLKPEQSQVLRPYLEALAPLDGFREEDILPMLRAYLEPARFEKWGYSDMRSHVRDPLLATGMVRWQDDRFVMDAGVQRALQTYLKIQWPDKWISLNKRALQLYTEFATKYGSASPYFQKRADHHKAELKTLEVRQ